VQFNLKRRQQFLSEIHYSHDIAAIDSAIQEFSSSQAGSGDTELEGWMISRRSVAIYRLHRLCLQYTGGDDIAPLRMQLEQVVDDFARYGELLWLWVDNQIAQVVNDRAGIAPKAAGIDRH
jgi:hypothetical protein